MKSCHKQQKLEDNGRQLLLVDGKHSAEEEHAAIQFLLGLRCDAIIVYSRFLSISQIDEIIDQHTQPIMVVNRKLRKITVTVLSAIIGAPVLMRHSISFPEA